VYSGSTANYIPLLSSGMTVWHSANTRKKLCTSWLLLRTASNSEES